MLVVGGGIIGSALALALARSGQSVAVVDEPEKPYGSATEAAGAMLGVFAEVTEEDDQLELRRRAGGRYPDFLATIDDLAGASDPLLRRGTFVVASGRVPSDLPALEAIAAAARSRGHQVDDVDPTDVPGVSPSPEWPCVRAVHLPEEGWIDTTRLLRRLRAALDATGRVDRVAARARGLRVKDGRVEGIYADGGPLVAQTTVLCAGAATASLLPSDLSDALPPMAWAKGTAVVLRPASAPAPHVIRTPNRQFACGLHAVPVGEGDVYVGATNRAATVPGVTGRATAGEVHVLLHGALHQLQTRWERAEVVGVRFGSRPLPADGLPVAGRADIEGLAVATGTYRNGVLLAPLLADILTAELLEHEQREPNPLSPIGRAARLRDRPTDVRSTVRRGAEDMVTTLLDPDGALPYGRSAEVAALLALLLERTILNSPPSTAASPDLARAVEALHRGELIPEVFHLLLRERERDHDDG